MLTIPEFYNDKDIFITGGTGLMGKVLIEKLLRSCPDVNKIFVLIRSKRGVSIHERIEQMKNLPLFDVIKETNPKVLEKIIPVEGDVKQRDLGLTPELFKILENVSIIFHSAASVRFDDPLKHAILLNTRGTYEVCKFAVKLKQLEAFIHVSTTYCNPHHTYIEEIIYPSHGDWKKVIQMAEKLDDETLDIFMKKLTDHMPNTYTYTKGLAEQICEYYKSQLPMVIFRPAIVTGSEKEPFPGWCDNMNGPVGLLIACGFGILRTMYASGKDMLNCIAVDIAIKAMIAAAWECGVSKKENHLSLELVKPDEVKIYNCASLHKIPIGFLVGDGRAFLRKMPFERTLWAANGGVTKCKFMNYYRVIFVQILPALLVDAALRIAGYKPFLMKIQRKITHAIYALRFFVLTQWEITNDNFLKLTDTILASDKPSFDLTRSVLDTEEYYTMQILGARRYILKESDETIPASSKRYERLVIYDAIIKSVLGFLLLYFLYSKFFRSYLSNLFEL